MAHRQRGFTLLYEEGTNLLLNLGNSVPILIISIFMMPLVELTLENTVSGSKLKVNFWITNSGERSAGE